MYSAELGKMRVVVVVVFIDLRIKRSKYFFLHSINRFKILNKHFTFVTFVFFQGPIIQNICRQVNS